MKNVLPIRLVCGALVAVFATACTGAASQPPSASAPPTSQSSASASASSSTPASPSPTKPPHADVTLQVDFFPDMTDAPMQYGITKGYFEDEGITLTILPSNGSQATLQQINANKIQFGYVDTPTYTVARMKDATPTTAIYAYFEKSTFAIWSHKPLKSPSDMIGTTFGTVPSSAGRVNLPFVLQKNGVDPSKVRVDLMDFSVLYQQLFKGALDSAETGLPGDEASFLTAEKQGVKLYITPASDWGFLDYPKMLIARNEIIQSNPDLVRRLVRAIHHSLTDALANASDVEMLAAAKVLDPQIDADAAKLGWDDVKKYESGEHGPMSADVFAEAIDLAKQSQGLTTTLKPEDLFTNEFVPAQ